MGRKLMIGISILALIMLGMVPSAVYAGGSGGEPLMSDEVGWGIVGALVLVGIYAVYKMKQETPPGDAAPNNTANADIQVNEVSPGRMTPRWDIIVAKW